VCASTDCCNAAAEERLGGQKSKVVEIGANRQSCDPSAILVLKSVFEVVLGSAAGLVTS